MKQPKQSEIIGQPADYSRLEIDHWLRRILMLTDWAPSRLAAAAGLAPSTLNRFLSDDSGPLPTASTMAKIASTAYRRIMERVRGGELSARDVWAVTANEKPVVVLERDRRDPSASREWSLPETFLRFVGGAEPGSCFLSVVEDESMSPHLRPGDFVIIDSSDTSARTTGVYAVDLTSGWSMRHIEPTDKGIVVTSAISKSRRTTAKALNISGRVIGMFRRM